MGLLGSFVYYYRRVYTTQTRAMRLVGDLRLVGMGHKYRTFCGGPGPFGCSVACLMLAPRRTGRWLRSPTFACKGRPPAPRVAPYVVLTGISNKAGGE